MTKDTASQMGDGNIEMNRLLDEITAIVSAASVAILKIRAGSLETRTKADRSPVTAADEAAEAIILDGLARVLPGVPVISEEAAERAPPVGPGPQFVLVDPLDGTRELIAGRDEFTVNVALVTAGRPHLGVVAAPALGQIWRGFPDRGAERLRLTPDGITGAAEPIRTRVCPPTGLVATVSRSHLDTETQAFLARLPVGKTLNCGSAIKFCQVAEGRADVYPRFGTTCEWDIAAGQAVLTAAGGTVVSLDGTELPYGRAAARFRVPGFIAWGDPAAAGRA
ncbi:MAG: 3'(2'),5'-bisphosphate nucleotidase CysQ [Xanthobacteraceae bacterium]